MGECLRSFTFFLSSWVSWLLIGFQYGSVKTVYEAARISNEPSMMGYFDLIEDVEIKQLFLDFLDRLISIFMCRYAPMSSDTSACSRRTYVVVI